MKGDWRANRIFEGFGHLVIRFRFLVVSLWITAAVVSTWTLPSLGSEITTTPSS